MAILQAAGGEQYQSEIVKTLGIPKSTVSSSLNLLHERGLIQKVKKGRENLSGWMSEGSDEVEGRGHPPFTSSILINLSEPRG